MTAPNEPREDFRKACRSLDRIGAALQVLAIVVLIGGVVATVSLGSVDLVIQAFLAAVVMYALGAVFDWFNRLGLFLIDAEERN